MFFEKYKSHYSLNFFATCGWLNFIGFLTFAITHFFAEKDSLDVFITSAISINWFFVFYATITFFIFMLENFYELRITNNYILNDKLIGILRMIGTIMAALPFGLLITAFLFLKF